MGTIGAGFSMSLDGFIAGPGDDVSRVFQWMFTGNTDVTLTIGEEDLELKVPEESAPEFEERTGLGAIVSGRRLFDVADAWGGKHPLDVPIVVLTHHPETIEDRWKQAGMPFTIVTDFESAIAEAKAIAGEKGVGVAGANVTQQCLKAGVLEDIGIDLVPVLLGDGVRLFDHLGIDPIELECESVTPASGVTHLRYRVKK